MKNIIQIFIIFMTHNMCHGRPYDTKNEEKLDMISKSDNKIEESQDSPLSFDFNSNSDLTIATQHDKFNTSAQDIKSVRICPFKKQSCDIQAEGLNTLEIQEAFKKSKDYNELLYLWNEWEKATMVLTEISILEMKTSLNDSSLDSNNTNFINSEDLMEDIEKLWREISPLYFELHKYVARKLQERYDLYFNYTDGLIPAHLLGTLSLASWENIFDFVKPYSEINDLANFGNDNSLEELEIINDYYVSIGFPDIIEEYNLTDYIGKDYEISCNGTENIYLKSTCRNLESEEIFSSPFHPFYKLIYFHIDFTNRNKSFNELGKPFFDSIGDFITLSSLNPLHLKEMSGLHSHDYINEEYINFLMKLALKKIVFLSYFLTDFKWKWDMSRYEQSEANLWDYREKIQKIKNPNRKFDSEYDISSKNTDLLNYFIATILEFQLYKGLCASDKEYDGETSPLHTCDFYGFTEIGEIFRENFDPTSAKSWRQILFNITGDTKLSAEGLMEYFEPLYTYLKEQNGLLTEQELADLLQNEYEEAASKIYRKQVIKEWESAIDVNNVTKQELQLKATLEVAEFEEHYRKYYFQDLADEYIVDESLRRQIEYLTVIGNSALDANKLSKLTNVTNTMTNIYSTAKVCPYRNQNCDLQSEGLSLEPDIEDIMASSKNYDELLYLWVAWRNSTGTKMKDLYPIYVNLSNEAAIENGFPNMAEMWVSDFESDTFGFDMKELWEQVKPLYNELHTYVGHKLEKHYEKELDFSDGLIPAHVLGNMWAQSWINVRDLVKPFPNATEIDITSALLKQNYSVFKMFEAADDFYQSLGLDSASMSYNPNVTIIEKPQYGEIQCHGSAWDFYDRKDFRIKMCASINYEDFVTIHHEMGHVQYYMLYKDQPITFRNGANPGFHEAVGDVITLSVTTPQHLKKIGLLPSYNASYEFYINSLMDMALDKVAFLPFGYLIDKWRWDIFRGIVPLEKWNSHWWHYRKTIQKVKPPVGRYDDIDFDPGAKFHVPNDYQYISYFVAHILQFQLYRSFCIQAGQYDPKDSSSALHKCDFYNSTIVGDKLRMGLSLGTSKHWRDVLKEMTNETDYDASALLEYFAPLYYFLVQENKAHGKMESRTANGSSSFHFHHLSYYFSFLLVTVLILL